MEIRWKGGIDFEIKTKNAPIILGKEIQVRDFLIEGEGEYEVSGVYMEVIENIVILEAEKIHLAYFDKRKSPLSDSLIDRIGEIDILLIPIGGKGSYNLGEAAEVINQIDPKIVLPMDWTNLAEITKIEGGTLPAQDTLKITSSNLPSERRVIILNASQ